MSSAVGVSVSIEYTATVLSLYSMYCKKVQREGEQHAEAATSTTKALTDLFLWLQSGTELMDLVALERGQLG